MIGKRILRFVAVVIGGWHLITAQTIVTWDCVPNKNVNYCADGESCGPLCTISSDMWATCTNGRKPYVYAFVANYDCSIPYPFIQADTFMYSSRISSFGDTTACDPPETKIWECWQDGYFQFGGCSGPC